MLVRDWVSRSLRRYFERVDAVARFPDRVALSRSPNRPAEICETLSAPGSVCWPTPVELYRPHFSSAVLRTAVESGGGPEVCGRFLVELGGGNGTHAVEVMRQCPPDAAMLCVDASEAMASRQSRSLADVSARCTVRGGVDCADEKKLKDVISRWASETAYSSSQRSRDRACVFAMELLDNLPHDKVILRDGRALQVHVRRAADGSLSEELRPLTDPLIIDALRLGFGFSTARRRGAGSGQRQSFAQRLAGRARDAADTVMRAWDAVDPLSQSRVSDDLPPGVTAAFVPTGAIAMLRAITAALPRHVIVLADFHSLPRRDPLCHLSVPEDGTLIAHGAPLVHHRDPATGAPSPLLRPALANLAPPFRRSRCRPRHVSCARGSGRHLLPHRFRAPRSRVPADCAGWYRLAHDISSVLREAVAA
jgi:hypothetical protein